MHTERPLLSKWLADAEDTMDHCQPCLLHQRGDAHGEVTGTGIHWVCSAVTVAPVTKSAKKLEVL